MGNVANCRLCNHPFRNLYEIKESGDEEKVLFAAVTRKHQIEANMLLGALELRKQSQCCEMPFECFVRVPGVRCPHPGRLVAST